MRPARPARTEEFPCPFPSPQVSRLRKRGEIPFPRSPSLGLESTRGSSSRCYKSDEGVCSWVRPASAVSPPWPNRRTHFSPARRDALAPRAPCGLCQIWVGSERVLSSHRILWELAAEEGMVSGFGGPRRSSATLPEPSYNRLRDRLRRGKEELHELTCSLPFRQTR